jgi:hypothetical protein
MKKLVKTCSYTATVAMVTLLLTSCATIVAGGAPKIIINGDVPEPVTIETEEAAYIDVTLPFMVKVKRHHIDGQRIKITSENYQYNDIMLRKTLNDWTLGNILIGGLIGWGIDLGTNCVSKPAQTEFTITPLPKKNAESTEGTEK